MRNSEGTAAGHLSLLQKFWLHLQSYTRLNISNMVSNMANMTTSLYTSQPIFKVVS